MDNNVELRFKKWIKILNYFGSAGCLIGYIWMLWFLTSANDDNIWLILGLIAAIAFSILWLLNTHQFKINFGAEDIRKSGAFNKEIPYDEIYKIKVSKDRIEIRGESIFRFVAIGNLNTNFEAAKEKLAAKIQGIEDIEIEGKSKYIDKHLKSATT